VCLLLSLLLCQRLEQPCHDHWRHQALLLLQAACRPGVRVGCRRWLQLQELLRRLMGPLLLLLLLLLPWSSWH
jgi:hypothetical protein